MLFYQYLQNENQKVTFEAIDKPDLNAACHMDVLKAGLEHEKYVTSLIHDIYRLTKQGISVPCSSSIGL